MEKIDLELDIPVELGAIEDAPDERDFSYEDFVAGAPPIVIPTFEVGFDLEEKYGKLFNDDQSGTYSCVGQGSSNDVEMDILINTGKNIHLSSKDIYRQIRGETPGASPRDAYKLLNKKGVCEDALMPTRMPSGGISEAWVSSNLEEDPETVKNALKYRIGKYYNINSYNMDIFARAIFENGGVGGGYRGVNSNMGHFIYFKGYCMWKGYKALKYKDSISGGHGDGFDKYIVKVGDKFFLDSSRGSQIILFSHWTFKSGNYLIDTNMNELTRKVGTKEVFLTISGKRYWIRDAEDFEALSKAQPLQDLEWNKVREVEQFTTPFDGAIIGRPNFSTMLKMLFGFGR